MALLWVARRSDALLMLIDPGFDRSGGCHGDSGGPVFTMHASVPALAGVVTSGNCDGVTVAVSLSAYRDWIRGAISAWNWSFEQTGFTSAIGCQACPRLHRAGHSAH
jgi:secreted trypsin-like serine protease